MNKSFDLVVIGGGSAGLVAAGGAATLGAKVLLIEKNKLGGDCLYTGCVPSKSLIRSAKLANDMRRAGEFGFNVPAVEFYNNSFAAVTNRVQKVIKEIEPHDAPEVFEKMGVEVVFGDAKFANKNELEIKLKDSGETKKVTAKRFCIATGSSPVVPPIAGLTEAEFITNENIFELQNLPKRLTILGGGAIGIEMAQAFQRLGSKVSIIEMGDSILSKEDAEIITFVTDFLQKEAVKIYTETKAVKVKSDGESKIVVVERNGATEEIAGDEILVAVGRKPNVENLNLEKAEVKYDEKRIETDEYLRTTAKNIFAAGDVTAHFQFTHTADYEAQIVIQNAFLFYPFTKKTNFRVVPWAIFTEPEIARVGLTETEARKKFGAKVEIIKSSFVENDRAHAEGEIEGFAKIILHKNKIIGAHIAGLRAGEIIHEFVLAMKLNLSLADLNQAIHIYPTLSKITQAVGTKKTLEKLNSSFVQKWFGRYLRVWR